MSKKTIEKFAIIDRVEKKVKSVEELCDTTLILAKKGKALFCLEKIWIEHKCHYVLVNLYTYKIDYKQQTSSKEYLKDLLRIGFELTYYWTWEDLLEDVNIKIPSKYSAN